VISFEINVHARAPLPLRGRGFPRAGNQKGEDEKRLVSKLAKSATKADNLALCTLTFVAVRTEAGDNGLLSLNVALNVMRLVNIDLSLASDLFDLLNSHVLFLTNLSDPS
jgi:hypothetical protein